VTTTASAFDLPARLAAKADAAHIGTDERHLALIAASLEASIADLTQRLDRERTAPASVERDLEIHRLSSRIRALRRFGLDVCLGRMVASDGTAPVFVGRFGLTDSGGRHLLLDWRAPAAEPFFGATHARPMGLASRRRYRWTQGRISDYWDEVFTPDAAESSAALDDQSAFIASLGSSRSPRMRDVLGTIQADQDAIIRAGSRGALVVDGGPGTGKTVVALHRAAYLLYSEPRLRRGGVLFVGPSTPYLSYVDDVLPSLGEDSVQIATLAHLVPEGSNALPETDPLVARVKSSARFVSAIEKAIADAQKPPLTATFVETPWADIRIGTEMWAEAFGAADPGVPHNEARSEVWQALLDILLDMLRDAGDEQRDPSPDEWGDEPEGDDFDAYGTSREDADDRLRQFLASDRELQRAFDRAWPPLSAPQLIERFWSSPEYLRACAPWLSERDVAVLQRSDPRAWTISDLPLLDAARQRLGDPEAERARRRREAAAAADRARMSEVVDDLIATDDSEMKVMSMLRGQDLRAALVDESALPSVDPDVLAGPFAHIVVDEAQELTDAQWQMLLIRCPSRSFTIVGDRAQARHGFLESWPERLRRVGLTEATVASLTINYRTPAEVMSAAEPEIRAAIPDANVPTSIRSSGIPVMHGHAVELPSILERWLAANEEGIACVIGDPSFTATERVSSLTAEQSKGLEFDLVVLVNPDAFGDGIEGAVDRYVAMTRATQQLVLLTS
jgi:DNA helicase IV